MVPHERSLVKLYAGRPFAILGVNSDRTIERVREGMKKVKIPFRSILDPKNAIAKHWNVRAWPSLWLIDHEGRIRARWRSDPDPEALDAAIRKWVGVAESAREE